MKKLYYNDLLLPEIPWNLQVSYQYFALLVRSQNDYVEMIGSTTGFYINTDDTNNVLKDKNSNVNLRLRSTLQEDGSWGDWVNQNNKKYSSWTLRDDRWVDWTNSDLPLGATDATEIYLAKSIAVRHENYPMVYYNGMLLPEIPDYFSTSYPYVFISEQSNRYNLCFSKAEYYFKSSDATLRPGSNVTNLWLTKTDFKAGAIWTYRDQNSYYFNQPEYPIWNSYGMKLNSASSATIVYPKTTPIPKDSMTEFLRVEYLQSSGYQYFDTGIIPNATTEVEIKYSIQVFSKYGPQVLSNPQWRCPFPRDDQSKFLGYRMGNQQWIELDPSLNTDYIVKAYPSGKVIINDVEYPGVEAGTATSTIPLHMFTYGSSSPGSTDYTSSTRVYYCKIWQDGELVRDFVPIFSTDGRCGMLDLVNNVIYYSMTCYGFLECQNLVLNDEEKDYPYEIKKGTLVKIANAVRTKMKSMQFMSPEEMVKNILNL